MFLDIYKNLEHLESNGATIYLSNYNVLGNLFVELINNANEIKLLLAKEEKNISKYNDYYTLKEFRKNKPTNNNNLKKIYDLIIMNFEKLIKDFDNRKEELENELIKEKYLYQYCIDNKKEVKNSNKRINSINKLLEEYSSEKRNTYKLEIINDFKEYIDLSCSFVNAYNEELLSIFNLNRLFIPELVLFICVQEDDTLITIDTINYLEKEIENKTQKDINENNISYIYTYCIYELRELICLYVKLILEKRIKINRCYNCNKYFITESRTDEKYCNRISPQNPKKTCKEYGAKKTYRDKLKSDDIRKAHYNTSQYYRMKLTRCTDEKTKETLNNKFEKYKMDYEKNKRKYNNKKITEIEFVNWINEQKDLKKCKNKK